MIKYALKCDIGHDFEGWFSNSKAFDDQADKHLIECPECGSCTIEKAIMSPAISTARKREATPESKMRDMTSKVRAHIRNNFDYVGSEFASEARAMHDGEKPERMIYGEASPKEYEAMSDEGMPVAQLPDEFAPQLVKKLN